ncbi:MAG: NAD(P)/FAD-dependent oxidoreductase [Methylocella sp.]
MAEDQHHVVIVGGGFGGLQAARALRHAQVLVTLVDRRNYHLFQPLLYQVATGALSPANIAAPLRAILSRQKNACVLLAEVVDLDVAGRRVLFSDGELAYDTLVLAAGSQTHYFGHDAWTALAPGLKSVDDATEMRRRILVAFEGAEREPEPDRRRAWLTFVIVGAGPTGVELAGALAEIARDTLKNDFRRINPAEAQILLLEGGPRILPAYAPELSAVSLLTLQRLGVTVKTSALVSRIEAGVVVVSSGGAESRIASRTTLWAAGVRASPLGETLAKAAGAPLDSSGRVLVAPDLSVPGHPEIFVIGDLAHVNDKSGNPLPGLAPVAMQEGRYVAQVIESWLAGKSLPPFRYRDYGVMATIGRGAAIADVRGVRFKGFFAWLVWLFVHLLGIVQFEDRFLILFQWAWNYFTRNRAARLITGEHIFPMRDPRPPASGSIKK